MNELAAAIHSCAIAHGWWNEERSIPEVLCLIHSEISEALEEYRVNPSGLSDIVFGPDDKPEGFAIELADVIIRTFDLCADLCIDIEDAVRVKMMYNATRPYRHGEKAA